MKFPFFRTTCLTLLTSVNLLFSQSSHTDHTGFGGPTFNNTMIAGKWTMEVGGLGGGFVNERFYIGGGGFALNHKQNQREYELGYGGLMLGYLWQAKDRTALNLYLIGSYGSIVEKNEGFREISDDFWALKPTIEVDFLLTKWLRIGVGGGFRWVMGSNISTLKDSDLSAPYAGITLRFGNWKY